MSAHATKAPTREPEIKTYEKAEAVELTVDENKKLSRETLLKWFKAKKYEKLKGLQEYIIGLAPTDLDALKEKIFENTRTELAKIHTELTKKEVEKRAEKFANALVGVASGIGNVKSIIEDFEKDMNDEKMFHHYIGSVGGVMGIANLKRIKENKEIKAVLDSQPGLSEELDEAIDSGDYNNVRDVLKKIPVLEKEPGAVDILLSTAMEMPQKLTGAIGMIGSGVNWMGGLPKKAWDAFRSTNRLMRSKVYKPVAKDLGVEYANLRNLGGLTVSQLIEKNRIFKKFRNLLEEKLKTTKAEGEIKKIESKLRYIDDTKIVTDAVKKVQGKRSDVIYKAYEQRLDKLQKANKISQEDKIRILSELDLNSVRVDAFLPLMAYEKEKDMKQDSNLYLVSQCIARWPKMKRAYKFIGGDVSVRAAHGIVGMRSMFEGNLTKFKKTFENFPNGKKLTSLFEDLSKRADTYGKSVSPDEVDRVRRTKAYMHDVKGHDDIMRMYYEASHHASKVLSAEAQKVIDAGGQLDELFKKGSLNPNSIPKGITDVLYDGGKIPKFLSAEELRRAYTQKLIDVRVARDTAQESFAALSQKVSNDVMGKFQKRWVGNMEIGDMKKTLLKETGDIKKYLTPGRRTWQGVKMLALPTIAVGIPVLDVVRGKARYRDIKWDLFDTAINFVPIAGTINDGKQCWTGRTTSGRKLGIRDRVMSGVFCAIGAVSDAAWLLGGIGGVMRAGIGGLRSARRLAHVGKLSKSVKAVQSAEGVTLMQRAGMRIGSMFTGLSTAKRMENYAESAAKIKAYNYLNVSKQLKTAEGFDSVNDLRSAEQFAIAMRGTKHAEAAQQYVTMMKHTGGLDYYKSLSNSFGFAGEVPGFLGAKMKFHEAMNAIRGRKLKDPAQIARLDEMKKTADVYQAYKVEKLTALEKYREAVAKGEGVEDALKNLKAVEGKLVSGAREYAKVQEEVFATAEKLKRTHLLVSQASKYFTYGGLGMGAYFMLTGKAPTSSGIAKAGGAVLDKTWDGVKWTAKHSTSIHGYQPPVDDLIDDAINNRMHQIKFAKEIKALEDGKDPKKRDKIHMVCARHWNQDFVRAWAMKHKDKLDIRKILNDAKKMFTANSGRLRQAAQNISGMPGAPSEVIGGGPAAS